MPRMSAEQKKKSPKNRIQFSCVLSESDNNLVRDYRFTQIMTTRNTELTLSDVIDNVFASFRDYLNNPAVITSRESAKKNEYRLVFSMRTEDYALLKEYRLKKILTTQDVNLSMAGAFSQILDIFRQTLKSSGYELMSRPSVVRESESRKWAKKSDPDQN